MSRLKQNKPLWTGLQAFFVVAVLFFLGRTLLTQWAQIKAFPWHFRIALLLLSIVLQSAAIFFWATVWYHMVGRLLAYPMRWVDGVIIYILSNLAKYIPGSVWGYASRIYLGSDKGLNALNVGISTVWEVGTAIVASLLLSSATLFPYLKLIDQRVFYPLLIVALLSFCGLVPPVSRWWMRLFGNQKIAYRPSFLRWQDFWLYLSAALMTHVLVGTAFYLFVCSLTDVSPSSIWGLVGIWSFSATTGLVIVLAPYGIGVREGVLTWLLQIFVSPGVAVLVSLASRLWTICGELLAALLVLALLRISKVREREK